MRERDGRKPGGVENLVGIGVAHAADETRIGESALEGAVFRCERRTKRVQIRGKDFDASGIDVAEGLLAAKKMQRGAALGAGFRKYQGAVQKVNAREGATGELGFGR